MLGVGHHFSHRHGRLHAGHPRLALLRAMKKDVGAENFQQSFRDGPKDRTRNPDARTESVFLDSGFAAVGRAPE